MTRFLNWHDETFSRPHRLRGWYWGSFGYSTFISVKFLSEISFERYTKHLWSNRWEFYMEITYKSGYYLAPNSTQTMYSDHVFYLSITCPILHVPKLHHLYGTQCIRKPYQKSSGLSMQQLFDSCTVCSHNCAILPACFRISQDEPKDAFLVVDTHVLESLELRKNLKVWTFVNANDQAGYFFCDVNGKDWR